LSGILILHRSVISIGGVRNIFALTWHGATIIGFAVKPTGLHDANAHNVMMRQSLSRIRSIIGSRVGIGASKTRRRFGLPSGYEKCWGKELGGRGRLPTSGRQWQTAAEKQSRKVAKNYPPSNIPALPATVCLLVNRRAVSGFAAQRSLPSSQLSCNPPAQNDCRQIEQPIIRSTTQTADPSTLESAATRPCGGFYGVLAICMCNCMGYRKKC